MRLGGVNKVFNSGTNFILHQRMKTKILVVLFAISIGFPAFAQIKEKLSDRVTIGVSSNIETYFIAEKLAVEHIGNYVFSNKEVDYSHQPIVYFAQKHFQG